MFNRSSLLRRISVEALLRKNLLATARVCETLNPSNLSGVPKRRSESVFCDQRWTVAAIHGSSDEPSPFVDIELHQAFVSHF
jgi:hypothetical protein